MGNAAGVWAIFASFARPGLIVPHAVVPDVNHIDWPALRRAGVEHIVIDKDNCVTLPSVDSVAPHVESSWRELGKSGFRSVLIVSNSAGSSDDPLAVGAEQVARQLGQTVLAHPAKKPANACAKQIVDVTSVNSDLKDGSGHYAVVGDRIMTDVVLANRIDRIINKRSAGRRRAIGILTTDVLQSESIGTRSMRTLELWAMNRLVNLGIRPGGSWLRRQGKPDAAAQDWQTIAVRSSEIQNDDLIAQFDAEQQARVEAAETEKAYTLLDRIRHFPTTLLMLLATQTGRGLVFLAQGWELILDGIRIGTKGRIGGDSDLTTLPRNRLDYLDKLERRPQIFPTSRLSPFNGVPTSRKPGSVRYYARRAATAAATAASTNRRDPAIAASAGQRKRVFWLMVLVSCIVIPSGIGGGVYISNYLDARKKGATEVSAMEEAGNVTQNGMADNEGKLLPRTSQDRPLEAPRPSPQTTLRSTSTSPHEVPGATKESYQLRAERMRVEAKLQAVQEKIQRVQARRQERVE